MRESGSESGQSAPVVSEAAPTGQPDLARIRDYYDQTWFDYWLLWLNLRNRAIHFG